jgi:O-antigen/teichoic acid export membrane protein
LTLALCLAAGRTLYTGVLFTAVVLLSFDLVFKALQTSLRWLLRGFERFEVESLTLVAERGLLLAIGVASLRAGYGVVGLAAVFAVVRGLDTSGLTAYVHARITPLVPRYDRRTWWDLFRRGLPFAYAGAMITLFFQIDAVMLERMRGAVEVGWYRTPVKVLEGLTLVPRVLGFALIPVMAALHLTAPQKVTELYRRGSKYLLVLGLPIAVFGVVAAEPFMVLLFGPEYAPSAASARFLIPAAVFMFLSNLGETTLACIDRWLSIVVISTAALILNVGLNLLWIPAYGHRGAALATLLTEAAYFLGTAVSLQAFGHTTHWLRVAWRPIVATIPFALVLWYGRGLGLLPSSVLASATFVVATLICGVWDQKERDLLRGLLHGVKPTAETLT